MRILPVHQWVKAAMQHAKMPSQAELARQLSQKLRRSIDRAAVNKMIKGERDVSADEMLAIEEITGLPVPSPHVAQQVPLIEWVAAGKLTEPRSQIPMEGARLLSVAGLGPGDYFALEVKGTSMNRISPDGSAIIVNRADRTLVSGKPYVFAWRGDTAYKLWQGPRGGDPAYLKPHSWDDSHEPLFVKKKRDMEVVGRVRRTVLDL
jgi:SOS-response transcriptional repressor LexA